ncbi:hypothetical protein AAG570_013570 [Ranatra chinensis]|uniref:Uncharacterized protein n=1 Tax=Ranatra chinensis TaxID=642074 RepID=A0ABD0YYY1_9HEMI
MTKKIGEELSIENQKLKAQIVETGRALLKTRETSAKLEDELHSVRLNLLKEGNMKDRVLDELKRAAREVARLTEAGEQLKKRADKRQSDMGQKINEIHKMFVLNSTKRVEEEMVNARLDLASLGKGQASLMVRLEEVDRYLRCGGAQTATVGVQTTLAADRMSQFEEAGRDTAEMVIRLREEMVDCKSQMIETKQQNEVLRQIIRDLKRSKEEAELVEQEDAARIASLERNFLDIRQFLEGSGRATQQPTVNLAEELETLRRELGELKGRQRTAPNPRFRTQTLPNNRPGNTQENWR